MTEKNKDRDRGDVSKAPVPEPNAGSEDAPELNLEVDPAASTNEFGEIVESVLDDEDRRDKR